MPNVIPVSFSYLNIFLSLFVQMAFQFIAQALCIPIWLIITPAIARENNQAQENAAERQQAYDVPILNNDEPNIQENDNADDDDDVPLLNNGKQTSISDVERVYDSLLLMTMMSEVPA